MRQFEDDKAGPQESACDHGITFDEKVAKGMSTHDISQKYPRLFGWCPKGCGFRGIAYASMAHYVYGDW